MTITEERTTFTTENTILTKVPQAGVTRQSSAPVTKRRMGIDTESLNILMDMLTNLYTNPESAVVREYISNALDSHIEAGQTDPIQVTLPSYYSKVLEVSDTGLGMSMEEMEDIYSVYGKSSKRSNFEVIGGFGLGSKSALAVSPSFTVTSVKDGWKTIMIMTRGEDGGGEVEFPVHVKTTEPNGVKVTIPVSDPYVYASHVSDFCLGLRPGAIMVDGIAPASYYTNASQIEGTATYLLDPNETTRSYYTSTYVNIGGVVYTIDHAHVHGDRPVARTITDIPIGAVDLTPSRDAIRYTDRSKKFLSELLDQINATLAVHIRKTFLETHGVAESLSYARDYGAVLDSPDDPRAQMKYAGIMRQHVELKQYSTDNRTPSGFADTQVTYWGLTALAQSATQPKYIIIPPDGFPRGIKTWVKRWNDDNYMRRVRIAVSQKDRGGLRMLRRAGWVPIDISVLQRHNLERLAEVRKERETAPRRTVSYFTRASDGQLQRYTVEDLLDIDVIINYPVRPHLLRYIEARTGGKALMIDMENKKSEVLVKKLKAGGYGGTFLDYSLTDITKFIDTLLTEQDKVCMYANDDLSWQQRGFISDIKTMIDHGHEFADPRIDALLQDVSPNYELDESVYTELRYYTTDIPQQVNRRQRVHVIMMEYPLVALDSTRTNALYSSYEAQLTHVAEYINSTFTNKTKDN